MLAQLACQELETQKTVKPSLSLCQECKSQGNRATSDSPATPLLTRLIAHEQTERKKTRRQKNICPEPGCHKKFSSQTSLKRHLITHSGEKPYPCRIKGCHACFFDQSNRNRHEREVPHPFR